MKTHQNRPGAFPQEHPDSDIARGCHVSTNWILLLFLPVFFLFPILMMEMKVVFLSRVLVKVDPGRRKKERGR